MAKRPVVGSAWEFARDVASLIRPRTFRRTFRDFIQDDIPGASAQLAYYLMLALFPFLLVLVALMGTFSNPQLATELLGYFSQVLPASVYDLLDTYTARVLSGRNPAPALLSVGILGTIWAASGAFNALIKALNLAYDVEETRPFWKVRGISILMTLGLSGLVLIGVVLLVAGPSIGEAIARYFGLGEVFAVLWSVGRWAVALVFLMVTVALIYYLAPAARQPFRWITPGGFVGVALWVLASLGFNLYVSRFGAYDETYGSIGTVIVLLLYLYISSLTILLGAELNSAMVQLKEELSGEKVLDAKPEATENSRG